ncbi:MAG: CHASE2 domain-containing protein, partial [Candidatus Tectomicrobia bacterium]
PAAVVVTVLLAILYVWLGESHWRPLRHAVFDRYQRAFPNRVDQWPVVIVDIDEASLAAIGQWPWPRTRLARLIEATRRLGARVVGLDIIMPEADRLSPQMVITDRPEISPGLKDALAQLPSNDTILAATLRRVPSVVGRAGTESSATEKPLSIRQTKQTNVLARGKPVPHVWAYADHITNVSLVEEAAHGRGYLTPTLSADGVARAMPFVVAIDGKLAPAFALELLRVDAGEDFYTVDSDARGIRGVRIGTSFIPTDFDGRIRLHYAPPSFPPFDARRRVSAVKILNDTVDANVLKDRVAIISVTAVGLADVIATPVAPSMDGVEVHAQLIENVRHGTRLVRPLIAPWVEVSVFLVGALALIVGLPSVRPGRGVALVIIMAVVWTLGGLAGFRYARWLVDPSFPMVGQGLLLAMLLTSGFAATDRRRRELEAALEAERAESLRIAGELRAARDIQLGLVPAPETLENLPETIEFYALLEPAQEVGGDLYDAFMLDAHHFFFLIGDVSGKGIPASLFMALSKTLYKSVALREQAPLNDVMVLANAEISRDNAADLFVTALSGVIDGRSGMLEWCRAGHNPPILLRPGEPPRELDSLGGPPLCVLDDFPYDADRVQLQAGDILVFITDGITEAQDRASNFYGIERTLTVLSTTGQNPGGDHSVKAICQSLYNDVKRFAEGAPPADDMTIMAIRFTGPQALSPSAR